MRSWIRLTISLLLLSTALGCGVKTMPDSPSGPWGPQPTAADGQQPAPAQTP